MRACEQILHFALGFLEIHAVISSTEVPGISHSSKQKSALIASLTVLISILSRPKSLVK